MGQPHNGCLINLIKHRFISVGSPKSSLPGYAFLEYMGDVFICFALICSCTLWRQPSFFSPSFFHLFHLLFLSFSLPFVFNHSLSFLFSSIFCYFWVGVFLFFIRGLSLCFHRNVSLFPLHLHSSMTSSSLFLVF